MQTADAQSAQIPTTKIRIDSGEKLFADNCSECHETGKQSMGPSLASITDKRSIPWLLNFIKNSQKVLQSGDPYAVRLFNNYNHMVMPEFDQMDDESILDILAYIKASSEDSTFDTLYTSNGNDNILLSKAAARAVQKDSAEINYFLKSSSFQYPMDLKTIQKGKEQFIFQCSACHSFDKRTIGPALASVTDRLPAEWLIDFIKSPKQLLESGDDYANFLASNYSVVMPEFEHLLSEEEMTGILSYIRYTTGAETHYAGSNANAIMADDTTLKEPLSSKQQQVIQETTGNEPEGSILVRKFLTIAFIIIFISLLVFLFVKFYQILQ